MASSRESPWTTGSPLVAELDYFQVHAAIRPDGRNHITLRRIRSRCCDQDIGLCAESVSGQLEMRATAGETRPYVIWTKDVGVRNYIFMSPRLFFPKKSEGFRRSGWPYESKRLM